MNSSASCPATSSAAAIASRGWWAASTSSGRSIRQACRRRRAAGASSSVGPQVKTHEEQACARRIAENLARRAFRRPVTTADIDSLMPYFDAADGLPKPQAKAGFDSGIEQVIAAVLVSPEFLFRAIRTPDDTGTLNVTRGRRRSPLSDLELASRLSFFLWSQGPDEALLKLAAAGKLHTPEALQAEALRMLKDRRASSLVRNFALKWLDLDKLAEVVPDPNLFPTFNDQLRQDMAAEIESFVASVLLEDRNVGDLLTADHTFLNERLAQPLRHHLGARPAVPPRDARRSAALGTARQGRGAAADVVRRSHLARAARRVGPGQADGHAADAAAARCRHRPVASRRASRRRRCARGSSSHRSKPGCNQCHGVIDPIGLAHGELRRHRPMARPSIGKPNAPIDAEDGAAERTSGRWPCRTARRAVRRTRSVRAGVHREAHDVRGRPRARVLRHAAGSGRGPARGGRRITGSPRSSRASSRAMRSACRRPAETSSGRAVHDAKRLTMFLTEEHLSRRTVLKGAGVTLALPLLDAMVPAATALAQTAAVAEDAHGVLLHPARRDHGQHVARPADGSVDAGRRGRRLQAEPDPRSRSSRTSSTSPRSATCRTRRWSAASTVSRRPPG